MFADTSFEARLSQFLSEPKMKHSPSSGPHTSHTADVNVHNQQIIVF